MANTNNINLFMGLLSHELWEIVLAKPLCFS